MWNNQHLESGGTEGEVRDESASKTTNFFSADFWHLNRKGQIVGAMDVNSIPINPFALAH